MDDATLDRIAARYPPADAITPAEFERYVADVFRVLGDELDSFTVTDHEVIHAADGSYDFDAVANFEHAGLNFRVLIEAKRHKNPIKRELVQALLQKMRSVGAQKAVLVSAGRFQSGAIRFALEHGIALGTLSEGRLSFETRSADVPPELTQAQARSRGMSDYKAMMLWQDEAGAVNGFALSEQYTGSLRAWLTRG